jgi:hypothetical protein
VVVVVDVVEDVVDEGGVVVVEETVVVLVEAVVPPPVGRVEVPCVPRPPPIVVDGEVVEAFVPRYSPQNVVQ